MSCQLLVPIDGSPLSKRALEYAFEHADDGSVVALHVFDPGDPGYSSAVDVDVTSEPPHGSDEWYDRAAEEEARLFEETRELAADYDADLSTESAIGDPAREIVDYAEDHDVREDRLRRRADTGLRLDGRGFGVDLVDRRVEEVARRVSLLVEPRVGQRHRLLFLGRHRERIDRVKEHDPRVRKGLERGPRVGRAVVRDENRPGRVGGSILGASSFVGRPIDRRGDTGLSVGGRRSRRVRRTSVRETDCRTNSENRLITGRCLRSP